MEASRRRGLVGGALLAAALVAGFAGGRWSVARGRTVSTERSAVAIHGARSAPHPPDLDPRLPVERVILCIGDGMGAAQIAAARIRAYGAPGRLALERLPVAGWVATDALGNLVTKSDAAATALASGVKTVNGRIGQDRAGAALPSVAERLRAAGGAVGLVTTTRITDATPAAFAAHVPRRRDQEQIAEQLVASGFDLLLGGGRRFFVPRGAAGGARTDGRDLRAEARARGITVVEAAGELAAAELPVLGLFASDSLPLHAPEPTLETMARFALARLGGTGRRFFLLLEEEGVDSAAHRGDLATMTEAVLRLDAAVAAAVEFAAQDGRTLVLVTGDHATGGLAIVPSREGRTLEVTWLGDLHTGEPVPLFAYGPGAARFAGMLDNTEVGRRLAELLGVAPVIEPPGEPALAAARTSGGD
jgi:alkaline phosphatase